MIYLGFKTCLEHELSLCDNLREKRMAIHAFLAGIEMTLALKYGIYTDDEREALINTVSGAQEIFERERYVQLHEPEALYEETQDGSVKSKCCGQCEAYGTKIGYDKRSFFYSAWSHCWRFNRPVCAVWGTCLKFERKKAK